MMDAGIVSIDKWTSISQVYFLTHLHSDHTSGLSSNWRKGPLYCSPITAKLFPAFFPGFDTSLIRAIEIGKTETLNLRKLSSGSKVRVDVTAIDARHCPGAVMYLFCGELGCMLYTGDFRWESSDEGAISGKTMLLSALSYSKLSLLYVDNTYCNPSFRFPPRKVAADQVLDIILAHPDHDILIAVDTLGKEDLLVLVAQTLKTKIWVWPERLQIMHLLGLKDFFTTDTSVTRVRAVPRYSLTVETVEGLNSIRCPTLGILPSGLPSGMRDVHIEGSPSTSKVALFDNITKDSDLNKISDRLAVKLGGSVKRLHQYIYSVSYSEHSCFSEIEKFINMLRPRSVRGIVLSSTWNNSPLYYFGHLCSLQKLPNDSYEDLIREETSPAAFYMISMLKRRLYLESNPKKKSEEIKRSKPAPAADSSGSKKHRVSILRQERCGVKIEDIPSP